MSKETRTVVYDDELRIEAYRFEGSVQPFPNPVHEHYVIGFVVGTIPPVFIPHDDSRHLLAAECAIVVLIKPLY